MEEANRKRLKRFVKQWKSDPSILTDPSLSFFRKYLESLGATVPSSASKIEDSKSESDDDMSEEEEVPVKEEEIVESDLELEGDLWSLTMNLLRRWEMLRLRSLMRTVMLRRQPERKAVEAISEGNLEEAIEHLTEAILLNPTSAVMYDTRASVYIKMKKPNAAIRDANASLEINPQSAKGYKSLGFAHSMLGNWEEAAKDLHLSSKLEFDQEVQAVLEKVETNVNKIQRHCQKHDKVRKEREDTCIERERKRRKVVGQKQGRASSSTRPGPFPGVGGVSGGSGPGGVPLNANVRKILNDPELMAVIFDPEVVAVLKDV